MKRALVVAIALSGAGCPNFDALLEECVTSGRCSVDGGAAGGSTAGGSTAGGGATGGGGGSAGGTAGGAAPMAAFTLSPSTFPFGNVDAGLTVPPATFTVTNTGGVTLTGLTTTLTNGAMGFTVRGTPLCPGALDAGDSCQVQVDYASSAFGSFNDTLHASTIEAGSHDAMLSATTPSPQPAISLNPPFVTFPYTSTATGSADVTVQVVNAGTPLLTGISAGLSDNVSFAVNTSGCLGMSLSTGQSCPLKVRFTPTAQANGVTSMLNVSANGGAATKSAALSGDAYVPVILTAAPAPGGYTQFVGAGDGGRCPPSCSLELVPDASVELTSNATGLGLGFAGWDGGCVPTDGGDLGNCVVRVRSDTTVAAYFSPANLAFVHPTPGPLDAGQRQAEAACDIFARFGLNMQLADGGGFVALLATGGDPFSRLGNARGWVRPDGGSIVDTVADLRAGRLWQPLSPSTQTSPGTMWLGVLLDGGTAPSTCNGYTAVVGQAVAPAPYDVGAEMFDHQYTVSCGTGAAFLCLGVNAHVRPPPPPTLPAGASVIFLSRTVVTGGSLTANVVCRNEAADAGLPGANTFVALRSSPTTAGVALLVNDVPRFRADGVLLAANKAAISSNGLQAPVNAYADGTLDFTPYAVATGNDLANVATNATSCSDWGLNSGTATVGSSLRSRIAASFNVSGYSCTSPMRLYCAQP